MIQDPSAVRPPTAVPASSSGDQRDVVVAGHDVVPDLDADAIGDAEKDALRICGRDKFPEGVPQPVGPRPLREPKTPTAAERAKHSLTHLPYQAWCPYCVAGILQTSPRR